MFPNQIVGGKNNLELRAVCEEGVKQVLLGVKPLVVVRGVIKRKEDVVDVDQDAGRKCWQNLTKKKGQVATASADMTGVDKEQGAAGEFETCQRTLFDAFVLDVVRNLSNVPRGSGSMMWIRDFSPRC